MNSVSLIVIITGVKKCRKNGAPWREIRYMKILHRKLQNQRQVFYQPLTFRMWFGIFAGDGRRRLRAFPLLTIGRACLTPNGAAGTRSRRSVPE